MWDREQLAEISVLADTLQAQGDPLGEWLALRLRLESGKVLRAERMPLYRRVRGLREQLGARVVLADDPALGRPHVLRQLGLIADVTFERASAEQLTRVFARPDAGYVLRLTLRVDAADVLGCLDRVARADAAAGLRQLAFEVLGPGGEPDPEAAQRVHAQLSLEAGELGERLPSLFMLEVDTQLVPLPHDVAVLESDLEWDKTVRTGLGRALSNPDGLIREQALDRLRTHGVQALALRGLLLWIIECDPLESVRAAAFAVVAQLGQAGEAIFALLGDSASRREDPQLRAWLEQVERGQT